MGRVASTRAATLMSVSGPPAGTLPEVRHGTQKSRSGAWVGVGVGLGLGLGVKVGVRVRV